MAMVRVPVKKRFLRYSLRTMLVVVLVLSVWLGWMANGAAKQRRAVSLVKELGGHVAYECEIAYPRTGAPILLPPTVAPIIDKTVIYEPRSEGLLDNLLGHDWFHWFHDVDRVAFLYGTSSNLTDEQLGEVVDVLPYIVHLHLCGRSITDAGLDHLASLKKLEAVLLHGTSVTDDGIARLQSQSPRLKIADIP